MSRERHGALARQCEGASLVHDVGDVRFFFFQAEDGIRDVAVTGVQTCALPISAHLRECCSRRSALAPRLAPRATGAIHPLHSCRSPTDAQGCSKSPQAARPDPSKSATPARRRPSGFCRVPHVRPRPGENPDTHRQLTLCPTRQFPSRRRRTNPVRRDRKSTRLNSSHGYISYAVFCLKKKKKSLILVTFTRSQRSS